MSTATLERMVDTRLWFDDGDIVLQAENYAYKVHRFMLSRESEFFKTMFSLPHAMNGEAMTGDGTTTHPAVVPQVTAEVFSSLLSAIYCRWSENLVLVIDTDREDHCIAILSAAHRLEMHRVFDALLKRLKTKINPVALLKLAILTGQHALASSTFVKVALAFVDISTTSGPVSELDIELKLRLLLVQQKVGWARLEKLGKMVATYAAHDPEAMHGVLVHIVDGHRTRVQQPPQTRLCSHVQSACFAVVASTSRDHMDQGLRTIAGYVPGCPRCAKSPDVLKNMEHMPGVDVEKQMALELWRESRLAGAKS